MINNSLKGHYAGFVSRLLAYALDIIVITVIFVFATWFLQTLNNFFQSAFLEGITSGILQFLVAGAAVVLLAATYFIFFWTLLGQTPGKMLLGLRIVSTEGKEITFGQALRRYIGYYLSALVFYIGYLWVLVDNRRQGWHDKFAGTIVIYNWDARPGELYQSKILDDQQAESGSEESNPSVQ
jgi:uncharacterized RDD family membrane protein YckC